MKILEVSLPSKVQFSNQEDMEAIKAHILDKGFTIFDEYRDNTYNKTCSIAYDFKILLAVMKSI